jgi:23S rRNA (uracil1939-C5)-methyltransferase
MAVKKGQTLERDVDQIAFGGKGICRVDGMAVFVDQAVPGDRVTARIYKKKKSYAEARVFELIEPSAHRVEAPCPYSGICGGCEWQFLDYERQLVYKRQHVQEALAHIGGIQDVRVHPTIASDRIFGYRNKMEFSCAERRWLLPEEMGRDDVDTGMALGLHVPGTFYKVLDIEACLLQPDLGNAILSDVRKYIRNSPLPIYGLKSHEGFWRFLVLRHSAALDQWMVNIVTASENTDHVQPLADQLFQNYDSVVSVVNNITARKSGVAVGEREIQLCGEAFIVDQIGNGAFELSANSFFQTNTLGARRLYDTARDYAGLTRDRAGRRSLLRRRHHSHLPGRQGQRSHRPGTCGERRCRRTAQLPAKRCAQLPLYRRGYPRYAAPSRHTDGRDDHRSTASRHASGCGEEGAGHGP